MQTKIKKGFTLIEILVVVAIVAVLAVVVMALLNDSKKKARLSSAMTSVQSALAAVISCNDSCPNGAVCINFPSGTENGITDVCKNNMVSGAKWPQLPGGYAYNPGDYSGACSFTITTSGDTDSPLTCNCTNQKCE